MRLAVGLRLAAAGLAAAAVALCLMAPAQAALSQSCADLRDKIVAMEREITSGAALSVDVELRGIYEKDCLKSTLAKPSDPWFAGDGTPASGPPPGGNGVFQAPREIAEYCRGSTDAPLCSLMLELGEGKVLRDGVDPGTAVPEDWDKPEIAVDPADELPPFTLAGAGGPVAIPTECLGALAKRLQLKGTKAQRAGTTRVDCSVVSEIPKSEIADLSAQIQQWRLQALADPTVPKRDDRTGYVPKQRAFIEMCQQAQDNAAVCRRRSAEMRTAGPDGDPQDQPSLRDTLRASLADRSDRSGTRRLPAIDATGQRTAFDDCANLYDSVVNMCRQSGWRPDPSRLFAGLLPHCQALVQNYLDEAEAKHGEAALAAFGALKETCPDAVDQLARKTGATPPVAYASLPPGVLSRRGGSGPLSADVFARCSQIPPPPECTAAPSNAYQGSLPGSAFEGPLRLSDVPGSLPAYQGAAPKTVPQGSSFNLPDILGFAAQIMSAAADAADALADVANAVGGGGSNMNSLATPIIRSPPGYGGPANRNQQPTHQSTITGIGSH